MGLKEMYSAAGAKILGASTAAKVIGTVAVTSAVIAGGAAGVHAYTNGQDFTPAGANRAMRANQVHFDGDESTVTRQDESEKDKKSESEMYERDENAEDQEKPQTGDSSSYLFDSVQQQETAAGGSLLDSSGAAAAIAGTAPAAGAGTAQPGTVLDIVSDPSKADVVLKPGAAGTTAETPAAGDNGGSTGSTGTTPVTPPYPVPDPDPTPTPTPPPDTKPSQPSKGDTSGGGSTTEPATPDTPVTPVTPPTDTTIPEKPPEESAPNYGADDSENKRYDQDAVVGGDIRNVVISGRYDSNSEGSQQEKFYAGQTLDEAAVVRALNAAVFMTDGTVYYWTSADLGKYLRVNGISFDGGETVIKEFPVTIPDDVGINGMIVYIDYRLDASDDDGWTAYEYEDLWDGFYPGVPCTPEQQRILVLKQAIPEGSTEILPEWIFNTQTSYTGVYFDQLYSLQRMMFLDLDEYAYLREQAQDKQQMYNVMNEIQEKKKQNYLFTGWKENGEYVPFEYTCASGRHVLEPGGFVQVPDGYTVRFTYEFDSFIKYIPVQTLTAYEDSVLTYDGDSAYGTLDVPEYVQAVDLTSENEDIILPPDFDTWSAKSQDEEEQTDYSTYGVDYAPVLGHINIPKSVSIINTDSVRVAEGYHVDKDNDIYASTDDGILMNHAETAFLAIPENLEKVNVPETITSVELPRVFHNELVLEAQTKVEFPDINFSDVVYNCKIKVQPGLMDDFVHRYGEQLEHSASTITEDDENEYRIWSDRLTDENGTKLERLIVNNAMYRIPSSITSIGANAFSHSPNLKTIVLDENSQNVTFDKDSFAGTSGIKVICIDEAQQAAVAAALKEAGISSDEAGAYTATVSEDGFAYFENGDGTVTLTHAPKDITEFLGYIEIEEDDPENIGEKIKKKLPVSYIGSKAFADCDKLTWVTLSEDTRRIGASAFQNCTALTGVLIENAEELTLLGNAFDNCSSLRFIASNAENVTIEGNYDIVARSKSPELKGQLWCPTYNTGYDEAWTCFGSWTGITEYHVYEQAGTHLLYGYGNYSPWDNDWNYVPQDWLLLRAAGEANGDIVLPTTTSEIYANSFENLDGKFTVNWEDLNNLIFVDNAAFMNSGLSGELHPTQNYYFMDLDTNAFKKTQLSSVDLSDVSIEYWGELLFESCENLGSAKFGDVTALWNDEGTEITAYQSVIKWMAFANCKNLTNLAFTTELPLGLQTLDSGAKFSFTESGEKDVKQLKISVPEGCEDAYITAWAPRYLGYDSLDAVRSEAAKKISKKLQGKADPSEEDIEAVTEYTLRPAKNWLRTMLGMELLPEITEDPLDSIEPPASTDDKTEGSGEQPGTTPDENGSQTGDTDQTETSTGTDGSQTGETDQADAAAGAEGSGAADNGAAEPSVSAPDAPSDSSDISDAPDEGESAASDNENTGSAPEDNGAAEGEAT